MNKIKVSKEQSLVLLVIIPVLFIILFSIFSSLTDLSFKDSRADTVTSFVKYSGTHFTLNGNPFYVGGTNNHYIVWASHNEIDNVLNDASAMHFNVVRTFASAVRGSLDGTTKPTIWYWSTYGDPNNLGVEGTYFQYWDTVTNSQAFNDGPTGLQHIDYVLSKAKSLNIKILLSFNDFHFYTGGMQQMGEWYGRPGNPGKHDDYTFVFTDPRVKQDYKDWISHLLNHVNVYTGVAYKDDPTIFAWDLANEPAASSKVLLQSWITEMSAFVKNIDHNHLLTSGDEGYFNLSGDDPAAELANPNIDFGTMHTYPAFTKLTNLETSDLIQQHCTLAKVAQKPVLLEEFGYSYQKPDQADVYKLWLDNLIKNDDCGGFTFWRLTSYEDNVTGYPKQNSEGFDIHNDKGTTSTLLSNEAIAIQNKNLTSSSSSSQQSSLISSSSSSNISSSSSQDSSSSSSSSLQSSSMSSSISSQSSVISSSSVSSQSSILSSSSSISSQSSTISSSSSSSSSSIIPGSVKCGAMDGSNKGSVDINDFSRFARLYDKNCLDSYANYTNTFCGPMDTNHDGKIDIIDFANFARKYGKKCS